MHIAVDMLLRQKGKKALMALAVTEMGACQQKVDLMVDRVRRNAPRWERDIENAFGRCRHIRAFKEGGAKEV